MHNDVLVCGEPGIWLLPGLGIMHGEVTVSPSEGVFNREMGPLVREGEIAHAARLRE